MSTVKQQTSTMPATRTSLFPDLRLDKWLGWFSVRAGLILLCLLWTVPIFGLLISSVRDRDAIATSGWWTALSSSVQTTQGRTGTAADQQEVDGQFIIEGDILGENANQVIERFSINANNPGEIPAGETIETRDGYSLTVNPDGTYILASDDEFELDRGLRFFYEVATPPRFTLENYTTVLESEGIGQAFLNTFTVTIPATLIPIAIAAFAAYAFSWMEFPFRNTLFILVVALLVVPLQMSLIPIQRVYGQIGLKDTYPGIWLAHTGFGLPLAIYLLRNYIGGLPREIIESAQIDGASHFQIFTRLIVPLSIPALASFSIFQFLWVWNDLLVARVFLGIKPENKVLTAALAEMTGTRGDAWHIMTSAAFISIIVPLMVFFSLQRYFVRGLLAGSVKGG